MVRKVPTRVLSIEDDEEFGKLLGLMLKSEDIEVVNASNGKEGLRIAEDIHPDLVVLDLMMPDLHGWLVYEQMRKRKSLSDIPVVVVTALASEVERSYGKDTAGVDAYLVKPIRVKELRSTIMEILSRKDDAKAKTDAAAKPKAEARSKGDTKTKDDAAAKSKGDADAQEVKH